MQITDVETFVLSNRQALVKISTSDGYCGWGEAVAEGSARATTAMVTRLAEHLVGEDPSPITRLWQIMARSTFYRGGPIMGSAVAGLDQALWDLKGRALDAPVHELLGGPVRDSARVYAHAGRPGRAGDPELARERVALGYTLVKFCPDAGPVAFIDSAGWTSRFLEEVAAMREAVGDEVDLAVDFHGRLSLPQSRRILPLLEPFHLAFVEEPLRPEHQSMIGELVQASSTPIACGERLYHRTEFRTVLEAGVAIVQPDVSHAFGITECFRIASQAEIYDAQLAPHCPLGPLTLAASLQLAFAVPNFHSQEQVIDVHDPAAAPLGLITRPEALTPIDGRIPRLNGPGLGVDVDEAEVRRRATDGPLDPGSPVWSHPDGGYAEW